MMRESEGQSREIRERGLSMSGNTEVNAAAKNGKSCGGFPITMFAITTKPVAAMMCVGAFTIAHLQVGLIRR
jgi:hypothetical protein